MQQINKVRTINFKGTITTVQPVSVSTPEVTGMLKDHQGNPYLPATSLRGAIRHAATDAVQSLRASQNKAIDVNGIYMLAQGVDNTREYGGAGNGSVEIGATQKYRDANIHMSLYGRWGLKSRLHVGNAFAQDKSALVHIGGGARNHVYERNERMASFVADEELDYLTDILNADSISSSQLKDKKDAVKELKRQQRAVTNKEERDAILAQIEAIELEMREVKDARVGASESIRRPIESFEAIDANVELPHTFRLISPSDDEFHYFLWCLAMYSYSPLIGGHQQIGCGEIKGEWEISEYVQGEMQPRRLGKVAIGSDGFTCDIEGVDFNKISQAIQSGELDLSKFIDGEVTDEGESQSKPKRGKKAAE